jgi:general secretion pathway protein G
VIIILGLLAAVVVRNFVGQTDRARVITTKASLKLLHNAVMQFQMDTGRFPTDEEGLMALMEQPSDVKNWQPGGYLETTEIPKDAWKRDFIYERFPESGKPFVIKSLGADGEEGGEDYNADLYSTDAD